MFRVALVVLWPLALIGDLFLALALVVAHPTTPRLQVSEVLLFVASTLINGRWAVASAIGGSR